MIPIIDLHQDNLGKISEQNSNFFKSSANAVDYQKLKKGGVYGSVFAICCSDYNSKAPISGLKKEFDSKLYAFTRLAQDKRMRHIKKWTDFNFDDGKINAMLHLEGADVIAKGIYGTKTLYKMGFRSIGIVWDSNSFAGSVSDNKDLTAKGKAFVRECNDLGIILDVSHLNEKSFYSLIKTTAKPVMASHSNCYALCPHKRNLNDRQIKAIARNNGVIGVSMTPVFVKYFKERVQDIEPTTTLDDICRHIGHIKDLVGIDHIALGSDFDGAPVPKVMKDVSQYQKILKHLKTKGYSDKELAKIAHENFLRVFRAQNE